VTPPYKEELDEMSVNINAGMRFVGRHGTDWQNASGAGGNEIESPFRPICICKLPWNTRLFRSAKLKTSGLLSEMRESCVDTDRMPLCCSHLVRFVAIMPAIGLFTPILQSKQGWYRCVDSLQGASGVSNPCSPKIIIVETCWISKFGESDSVIVLRAPVTVEDPNTAAFTKLGGVLGTNE
jgi:hypothetical protein